VAEEPEPEASKYDSADVAKGVPCEAKLEVLDEASADHKHEEESMLKTPEPKAGKADLDLVSREDSLSAVTPSTSASSKLSDSLVAAGEEGLDDHQPLDDDLTSVASGSMLLPLSPVSEGAAVRADAPRQMSDPTGHPLMASSSSTSIGKAHSLPVNSSFVQPSLITRQRTAILSAPQSGHSTPTLTPRSSTRVIQVAGSTPQQHRPAFQRLGTSPAVSLLTPQQRARFGSTMARSTTAPALASSTLGPQPSQRAAKVVLPGSSGPAIPPRGALGA